MKPETVVKMIDSGINPMDTDIWTVNDYLSRMNQGATKDNEEKYSRFLYKLDKTGGITETKKKQFIGIYQMMNIFTRDAGVCAGALMKQGKEITMGNLISAYTSRKHSGIDVTIDDTVEFTKEDKDMVSYFESLFAKSQQYITPNTLKESDIDMPIEDQHVEHFAENLAENYDEELEKQLDSSYIKDVTQKAADADAEVTRELRRAGINENIGNINAVNELLATGELMAYTRALKGKGIEVQKLPEIRTVQRRLRLLTVRRSFQKYYQEEKSLKHFTLILKRQQVMNLRRLLRVHLQIQRKFLLTMIHLKN